MQARYVLTAHMHVPEEPLQSVGLVNGTGPGDVKQFVHHIYRTTDGVGNCQPGMDGLVHQVGILCHLGFPHGPHGAKRVTPTGADDCLALSICRLDCRPITQGSWRLGSPSAGQLRDLLLSGHNWLDLKNAALRYVEKGITCIDEMLRVCFVEEVEQDVSADPLVQDQPLTAATESG